jgi:hypothetical protein
VFRQKERVRGHVGTIFDRGRPSPNTLPLPLKPHHPHEKVSLDIQVHWRDWEARVPCNCVSITAAKSNTELESSLAPHHAQSAACIWFYRLGVLGSWAFRLRLTPPIPIRLAAHVKIISGQTHRQEQLNTIVRAAEIADTEVGVASPPSVVVSCCCQPLAEANIVRPPEA